MRRRRLYGFLGSVLGLLASAGVALAAQFAPANYDTVWPGIPYELEVRQVYSFGYVTFTSPGTQVNPVRLFVDGRLEAVDSGPLWQPPNMWASYATNFSGSVYAGGSVHNAELIAYELGVAIAWDYSQVLMEP